MSVGTQPAGDRDLFLLWLRHREGQLISAAGNQPVLLNDSASAWVVFSGHVELFAVRVEAGRAVGPRRHLFRADPGEVLFGTALEDGSLGLLASGGPGTQVVRLTRSQLATLATDPELAPLVAPMIAGWVGALAAMLGDSRPSSEYHELGEGHGPGPVDRAAAPDWDALDRFHHRVLAALAADAEQRELDERERIAEKRQHDHARVATTRARLASALAPAANAWVDVDTHDPLLAACQLVGSALGIAIKPPPGQAGAPIHDRPLEPIARASGLRARRVRLRGTWWTGESGPLLGYLGPDRRPVALLPARGGYELVDPGDRSRRRLTASLAATLDPFAFTFYRPFAEGPVTARGLLAFGLRDCRPDLLRIFLAGVGSGLLGLLTPIVIGLLFDPVIPGAQRSLLLQLGAGLLVVAGAGALFELSRGLAIVRLSVRLAATEAAVMDRLIALPATFFRDYTVGDLQQRALGLQSIRETISGAVVSVILSASFSVFSFALLFSYDARLALLASGLVLVLVAVLVAVSWLQVRYQRTLGYLTGRTAGLTLQLITGVLKLRVAGAEDRAFAIWAGRFADQRRVAWQNNAVSDGLAVFSSAYPLVTSLAVFGVVVLAINPQPPVGAFLAFHAALGQFVAAIVALGGTLSTIIGIVPTYERTRPILAAQPEVQATKAHPGRLRGAIELDHVTFRYRPDSSPVLADVSLTIEPGQFVALVGPSGSGKSTLLRLLLGFETPESGTIRYDGHDLATIDVQSMRRQIGTVLQSARLLSGDVLSNIVGASMLGIDDAWAAAEMAGLAEQVRAMPMGLHTIVGDGGGTLSGGQRQRVLIARALVARPRIVFFDEATSALDNRTQEIVGQSLEGLAATRVVIAHRLSTVMNADRMYVLRDGRIVESGTYRQLIERGGVFADLARRQLI